MSHGVITGHITEYNISRYCRHIITTWLRVGYGVIVTIRLAALVYNSAASEYRARLVRHHVIGEE